MSITLDKFMESGRGARYSPLMTGEVGIEIETETKQAYDCPEFNYWTTHSDGSLRNYGIEYVLARPLDYDSKEYKEAMKEFATFAVTRKFLPSVYTSVHVHLNMRKKTLTQIANFITLYLLMEEILGRYVGSDRDGNLFCLKTSNAERNLTQIVSLFSSLGTHGPQAVLTLQANSLKYAGLNIAPLRNFGSLEVRTHGGTTDTILIHRWIGLLHSIYRAANNFNNPRSVFDSLKRLGHRPFFDTIFGDLGKLLDTRFLKEDFDKTMWYAMSVADCVEDWSTLGQRVEKKQREVKTLSKGQFVTFFHDEDLNAGTQALELQNFWDQHGLHVIYATGDN